MSLPPGITSFKPAPSGYLRWTNPQTDWYNAELRRIESRFKAGHNVDHLVNGLYNLANMFDYA